MQIALIGNDVLQSKLVEGIGAEFRRHEHDTVIYTGNGTNICVTNETVAKTAQSDLLVIALSEYHHPEVELAMRAKKLNQNLRIVLYIVGGHARRDEAAQDLQGLIDLVFVVSEKDLDEAARLYPSVKAHAIGNLGHEEFCPTLTKAEAREIVGLPDDPQHHMIFVPGDKWLRVNYPLFLSTMIAARMIRNRNARYLPYVAIGMHPGDEHGNNIELYYRPLTLINELSYARVPVHLFTRDTLSDAPYRVHHEVPGTVLVTACDIMVTAYSTLAVAAAFQRKPVIGFCSKFEDSPHLAENNPSKWELAQNGSAVDIRDGSIPQLANAMERLLTNSNDMRTCQEAAYPEPPELGSVAKRAVDIITRQFFL